MATLPRPLDHLPFIGKFEIVEQPDAPADALWQYRISQRGMLICGTWSDGIDACIGEMLGHRGTALFVGHVTGQDWALLRDPPAQLLLVGQPDLPGTLDVVRTDWLLRGVVNSPDEAVEMLCQAAPMLVMPSSERRAVRAGAPHRMTPVLRAYDTRAAVAALVEHER